VFMERVGVRVYTYFLFDTADLNLLSH